MLTLSVPQQLPLKPLSAESTSEKVTATTGGATTRGNKPLSRSTPPLVLVLTILRTAEHTKTLIPPSLILGLSQVPLLSLRTQVPRCSGSDVTVKGIGADNTVTAAAGSAFTTDITKDSATGTSAGTARVQPQVTLALLHLQTQTAHNL